MNLLPSTVRDWDTQLISSEQPSYSHRLPRRARHRWNHLPHVNVHTVNERELTSAQEERLEIIGLYWHFVDVVWIVIFTIVYLFPQ